MITYDDKAKPTGLMLALTYVVAAIVWLLSAPIMVVASAFD